MSEQDRADQIQEIAERVRRRKEGRTHWDGCYRQHGDCETQWLLDQLAAEHARREAAERERDEGTEALRQALTTIADMAGSHTVPIDDNHPAGYSAIYRTATAALRRRQEGDGAR